jgi:hypothetical protein
VSAWPRPGVIWRERRAGQDRGRVFKSLRFSKADYRLSTARGQGAAIPSSVSLEVSCQRGTGAGHVERVARGRADHLRVLRPIDKAVTAVWRGSHGYRGRPILTAESSSSFIATVGTGNSKSDTGVRNIRLTTNRHTRGAVSDHAAIRFSVPSYFSIEAMLSSADRSPF